MHDVAHAAYPLLGISQRVVPTNLIAEQATLGALLTNNRAYDQVSRFLKAEHFADPINARIYDAIARQIEDGHRVDAITLKAQFENAGILDEVGGIRYLAELLSSMVGIPVTHEYGRAIHDCWARRQLIALGVDLVDGAFGADPDLMAADVALAAIDGLSTINEAIALDRVDFATAAQNVVDRAEAAYRGDAGVGRLDTGIDSIDRLWNGLWPGRLYYLMTRSRTGKTSAMAQFCRHIAREFMAEAKAARRDPDCIHIVSLDMGASDFQTLCLAGETRWTADQITAGDIGEADDWMEFVRAAKELGELPIVIDGAPLDWVQFALRARAVKRQRNTRLLCIDYMDLINKGQAFRRMERAEWIPTLGDHLKRLAVELNVAILVLCQVNKARDLADSTRPTITDLPFNGGNAADEIYALYRRELDMAPEPIGIKLVRDPEKRAQMIWEWDQQRAVAAGQAEFIALKRRFGPLGVASLRFDGPRMSFSEIAVGPEPSG